MSREFFLELQESDVKHVTLADGKKAIVEGEGPGVIQSYDNKGKQTEMKPSKALYTPTLAMNLLSLAQKNATVKAQTQ